MSAPDFTRRDAIRREFAADLLSGNGIEIGAGPTPQMLPSHATVTYYDMRDAEQLHAFFGRQSAPVRPIANLKSDFPGGCDFLIAHNVLEHSPNPIGQLSVWNACVRDGGVVLLSLPHHLYCPDERRIVPPLSHLVEDAICDVDGSDFVSREHGASFFFGWWEDFCRYNKTEALDTFARLALDNIRGENPDIHWHAFDSNLVLQTVVSAAILSHTEIRVLRYWRPEAGETIGDILIAYSIIGKTEPHVAVETLATLQAQWQKALHDALKVIDCEAQSVIARHDLANPKVWACPLSKPFCKEGDFCFRAPIPTGFTSAIKPGMTVSVRENGHDLGPAESVHQHIRDHGAGAFSMWGQTVYFSSSDGSDCNSNGRQYALVAAANHIAASRSPETER